MCIVFLELNNVNCQVELLNVLKDVLNEFFAFVKPTSTARITTANPYVRYFVGILEIVLAHGLKGTHAYVHDMRIVQVGETGQIALTNYACFVALECRSLARQSHQFL